MPHIFIKSVLLKFFVSCLPPCVHTWTCVKPQKPLAFGKRERTLPIISCLACYCFPSRRKFFINFSSCSTWEKHFDSKTFTFLSERLSPCARCYVLFTLTPDTISLAYNNAMRCNEIVSVKINFFFFFLDYRLCSIERCEGIFNSKCNEIMQRGVRWKVKWNSLRGANITRIFAYCLMRREKIIIFDSGLIWIVAYYGGNIMCYASHHLPPSQWGTKICIPHTLHICHFTNRHWNEKITAAPNINFKLINFSNAIQIFLLIHEREKIGREVGGREAFVKNKTLIIKLLIAHVSISCHLIWLDYEHPLLHAYGPLLVHMLL